MNSGANRSRAWMHEELGDKERFWAITEENLEDARAHGHKRIEARSLGSLAERAAIEGRFEDADALLAQSFRIDVELGNLPFVSVDLVRVAVASVQVDKPLVGAQLLSRAMALRDEIGFALESWMTKETDEAFEAVHAELDDTAFAEAWKQGAKLSLDETRSPSTPSSDRDPRVTFPHKSRLVLFHTHARSVLVSRGSRPV